MTKITPTVHVYRVNMAGIPPLEVTVPVGTSHSTAWQAVMAHSTLKRT